MRFTLLQHKWCNFSSLGSCWGKEWLFLVTASWFCSALTLFMADSVGIQSVETDSSYQQLDEVASGRNMLLQYRQLHCCWIWLRIPTARRMFSVGGGFPQTAPPLSDLGPQLIHSSLDQLQSIPQMARHLGWFSRQQTHRPHYICNNRLHLTFTLCLWVLVVKMSECFEATKISVLPAVPTPLKLRPFGTIQKRLLLLLSNIMHHVHTVLLLLR